MICDVLQLYKVNLLSVSDFLAWTVKRLRQNVPDHFYNDTLTLLLRHVVRSVCVIGMGRHEY